MTRYGLTSRQVSILLIIAAAGILARGVALDRSYWFDELATLIHVDVPDFVTVLRETAQDKQPPLYNGAAFFWVKLFGPGEIAVRALSLIFGLLTLATPWIARTALNRSEKLLSFAVLCVMSLPIKYAQEARNYSLLLFFAAACLFTYYELLTRPSPRLRAGFYLALCLLALCHLFGLLLAVSYAAVIFLRPHGRYERLGAAIFAVVMTAVVLVPLVLGGAAQAAGGNFWLKFTPQSFAWALLMVFTPVGIALLAYAALVWRRSPPTIGFDPMLAQALAPTALMFLGGVLISFHTPLINDRNLIGVIPAFALLIARLLQRAVARDAVVIPMMLIFLLLVQSALMMYFGKLFIREDFRDIARQSIAADTGACYVLPDDSDAGWHSIMSYYVTRLFHRPDLAPQTFARSELATARSASGCRLWADAHPEGRASDLASLSQFRGCVAIPLYAGHAASTSLLLNCPK
jgi:uncharacterized membrane protein